jgi:hypothetical protein
MIGEILLLLKNAVNDHLNVISGRDGTQPEQEYVVFLESETVDSLPLKLGAVTLLLVNLEEEHAVRPADPHRRTVPDGTVVRVEPPIYLAAYVLFVARYKDYQQSLRNISSILQFFQRHRIFDRSSMPALSDRIGQITIELLTIPFAEQNNLWSLLRSSYQPSLLYQVRMAVFQDEQGVVEPPVVEPIARISR